jgi:tetratricopeptide (TPR) repeat protein
LSNYEAALLHFEKAIQTTPASEMIPAAYGEMAIVYFHQNRLGAAQNAYRMALRMAPGYDHALVGLAVLHAAEDRWDEALDIWHSLRIEYFFLDDIEDFIQNHYRWTPPMADIVRQIAARANA